MKQLKNVLMINALTSGAAGAALLAFNGPVASLFGAASHWPFIATGAFLFVFALIVWVQSRRAVPAKGWVQLIITLDILWVLDSALVLLLPFFNLTGIGDTLIALVALWVALMAVLQFRGLKAMQAESYN